LNLIRLLSIGWQHHALGVFMMLVSDSSEVTQYCDRGIGIGRDEQTIAVAFMVSILISVRLDSESPRSYHQRTV
jgi:hypothetical protein